MVLQFLLPYTTALPLLSSLGQVWNIQNKGNCCLESTQIVAVFYAQATHQRKEIRHLSPPPTAPKGCLLCSSLSSDHSCGRDNPHSIINDAVRQKGNKLNGVRLPFALGNDIKYYLPDARQEKSAGKEDSAL